MALPHLNSEGSKFVAVFEIFLAYHQMPFGKTDRQELIECHGQGEWLQTNNLH